MHSCSHAVFSYTWVIYNLLMTWIAVSPVTWQFQSVGSLNCMSILFSCLSLIPGVTLSYILTNVAGTFHPGIREENGMPALPAPSEMSALPAPVQYRGSSSSRMKRRPLNGSSQYRSHPWLLLDFRQDYDHGLQKKNMMYVSLARPSCSASYVYILVSLAYKAPLLWLREI
jgi:hypothetical protein